MNLIYGHGAQADAEGGGSAACGTLGGYEDGIAGMCLREFWVFCFIFQSANRSGGTSELPILLWPLLSHSLVSFPNVLIEFC